MSRRTLLAGLTATVLLGGLAAPALASPLGSGGDSERTSLCLRLEPEGEREGLCVWLPFKPSAER